MSGVLQSIVTRSPVDKETLNSRAMRCDLNVCAGVAIGPVVVVQQQQHLKWCYLSGVDTRDITALYLARRLIEARSGQGFNVARRFSSRRSITEVSVCCDGVQVEVY